MYLHCCCFGQCFRVGNYVSLPVSLLLLLLQAELPPGTTLLPREKPVPEPRPETRWERFAKEKGIKKRKKSSRMVYDEQKGEWRPRWGYKVGVVSASLCICVFVFLCLFVFVS